METVETSSLQELVQQKENEWREAQELQIKSLQSALKEKERQLNNEKLRFRKLKGLPAEYPATYFHLIE